MAIVTATLSVDNVAAQADQSAFLPLQVKRNGCDGEAPFNLAF
jgi:hypothetical protein